MEPVQDRHERQSGWGNPECAVGGHPPPTTAVCTVEPAEQPAPTRARGLPPLGSIVAWQAPAAIERSWPALAFPPCRNNVQECCLVHLSRRGFSQEGVSEAASNPTPGLRLSRHFVDQDFEAMRVRLTAVPTARPGPAARIRGRVELVPQRARVRLENSPLAHGGVHGVEIVRAQPPLSATAFELRNGPLARSSLALGCLLRAEKALHPTGQLPVY